jgi:hypothetical protein
LSGARCLRNKFLQWGEGGKDDADTKKGHGRAFCFPELMCYLFAALGTNEIFSVGKCTTVRLQSFNETYTEWVKWMKEQDKWRDQYVKPVTDIMSEYSIQDRVKEVNTRTQETPISYQQSGVVKVVRNDLAPLHVVVFGHR